MASTILVANPTARSGRAEARIARARGLLDAAGLPHEFVPTEAGGGTIGAVRRAIAAGARTVVALGGDGTFAEVAKGVLASDHAAAVKMGMLPMGTANDQGKSFGMRAGEAGLADNVAVIAAGHTIELDVGRVRQRDEADRVVHSDLFFDSFSIGLGAAVLAGRNRDRERTSGVPLLRALYRDQMIYAGALARQLAASLGHGAGFALEAVIDGVTHTYPRVLDVIIKNTPVYGGEWILAPGSAGDDGLLELVPITGLVDLGGRMVSALRHLQPDEGRAPDLERAEARAGVRFELTVMQAGAAVPPPAQIDGEELPPGDRFSVEVLPRLLHLIVPARAAARATRPPLDGESSPGA